MTHEGPSPHPRTRRSPLLDSLRRSRTAVLTVRALRLLREGGPSAFTREAVTRLLAFMRYGIPPTSPGSYVTLNVAYERWLRAHTPTRHDVEVMTGELNAFPHRPLISVLVPVYNTRASVLHACLRSVLAQVYPDWELCLVNDASTRAHVRSVLDGYAESDERINVLHLEHNVGISAASNRALQMARGEFIALLDHDDELTPDALFHVVKLLNDRPSLDLVYSDEDKRSPRGRLVDPFFKPGWSPDLLHSMNYITHLAVYHTSIVRVLGGFRAGFDGSQDYDLLLRVSERTREISHLPRILYHYRQIGGSAALDPDAKPYAYVAAMKALEESIERRGQHGSVIQRSPGYYHVRYEISDRPPVAILTLGPRVPGPFAYPDVRVITCATFGEALRRPQAAATYVVLWGGSLQAQDSSWIDALLEHAQRPEVGAVGPIVTSRDGKIAWAGLLIGGADVAQPAFDGWRQTGWGTYQGVLTSTRNCSALAGCLMIRRAVLNQVGPLEASLHSPGAEIDVCLRLRRAGYQIVCTPHARMTTGSAFQLDPSDRNTLRSRWHGELSSFDPYLNENLLITPQGVAIRPGALRPGAPGEPN